MSSPASRLLTYVTFPVQVVGRLPELVDAVIRLPDGMEQASRELRHTRQELEEAELRLDRLIRLSETAIDEMDAAVSHMQDGNARLEKLTPLAETAVDDMQVGIATLRDALGRLDELTNAVGDVPLVDTEDG